MLSDNLAPIISPHPGKVLPVYPVLESLSRKSDGIEDGSVECAATKIHSITVDCFGGAPSRLARLTSLSCARLVRALTTSPQEAEGQHSSFGGSVSLTKA